jgi:hypothetical protein
MQNGSKLGPLKYEENVWKRTPERWETKLANCKVTPQAIRPIAKSLTKKGVHQRHYLQFMIPQAPYFIQLINQHHRRLLIITVQSA